jgi:hypothetical protein
LRRPGREDGNNILAETKEIISRSGGLILAEETINV